MRCYQVDIYECESGKLGALISTERFDCLDAADEYAQTKRGPNVRVHVIDCVEGVGGLEDWELVYEC